MHLVFTMPGLSFVQICKCAAVVRLMPQITFSRRASREMCGTFIWPWIQYRRLHDIDDTAMTSFLLHVDCRASNALTMNDLSYVHVKLLYTWLLNGNILLIIRICARRKIRHFKNAQCKSGQWCSILLILLDRGAACDASDADNSIFGSSMSEQLAQTHQMYLLDTCH